MKKLFLFILILGLIYCGGGGGGGGSTPPPPIIISISPSSATCPAGGAQQFTANIQNTTNTAVTWQVNAITGGDSIVGTILTNGLYTAPLSPPETGTVTVTAVSQADSTKSSSATVIIVFSNATLSGQYAFQLEGVDTSGDFFVAGSFYADGNGNLTNGVEDLNHFTGIFPNLPFTGFYSVEPDGRGSATITSSQGTSDFCFVLLSNDGAVLIEFDTFAVGVGLIVKQDSNAFSNSALGGDFAFSLSGLGFSRYWGSSAGRFTMDGMGGISAGVEDSNDSGSIYTNVPFTGIYNVGLNGRGTATLVEPSVTLQFSFYVISANQILIVSLDYLPAMIGSAERQQGAPFTNASLWGDYVFACEGASTSGSIASVGRFTANGLGGITSGVLDENDAGLASENVAFTGTYNISSNGRGTATLTSALGTYNFAFYMVSSGMAIFEQVDSFAVSDGTVIIQLGGPFTTASISGNFWFALGEYGVGAILGQLVADGFGNLSGTEDVNDYGTLWPDVSMSGTYAVSSNGRGVATVTTPSGSSQLRFYIGPGSVLLIVGVDSTEVLSGLAGKQF
jgi:hypothetical protein